MSTNEKIIALHGAGMRAGVWETLGEKLPLQALFFPIPLLASIEEMAAWLEAQLSNHLPQSVVLMGHSMGALVALEAARHPAVAALVLIGAAAQMPVHPDLLKQAADAPDAAAGLILKWGVSLAHPEAVEVLKKYMQPNALSNDLSACNAYQHGEAAARNIEKPVLVLGGSDDKLTKAAAGKALAETFQNGRFHLVPGSGHMLMVEDPAETAREIGTFLLGIKS